MRPNTSASTGPALNPAPSIVPGRLALLGGQPPPTILECASLFQYLRGSAPAEVIEVLEWCVRRGLHNVVPALQRDYSDMPVAGFPGMPLGPGLMLDYLDAHPDVTAGLAADLRDPAQGPRIAQSLQHACAPFLVLKHVYADPAGLQAIAAGLSHARVPLQTLFCRTLDTGHGLELLLQHCGPELLALDLDHVSPGCAPELQRIVACGKLQVLRISAPADEILVAIDAVHTGLQAHVGLPLNIVIDVWDLDDEPAQVVPVLQAVERIMQRTSGTLRISPELLMGAQCAQSLVAAVRQSARIMQLSATEPLLPPDAKALLDFINGILASRFPRDPGRLAQAVAREFLAASFAGILGQDFTGVARDIATNLGPRLSRVDVAQTSQVDGRATTASQTARQPVVPPKK